MADYVIEAQRRHVVGKKVKTVRAEGFVPISVYGPNIEPMTLQVPYRALELTLLGAGGSNLIDLNIDGKLHPVVAREVQRDVLKRTIIHADFFAVDADSTIVAEVPINFINESPAVIARQGILITGTNTITIEVLPADLRSEIEVDLSILKNVGDSISVSDLVFGERVTILNDPDEMVARVSLTSAARSEELLGEEGEEDIVMPSEPEVISKGKDEDEE